MEYREQQMLKRETGFDENVIGCFLSNYGERHVCPIATGKWCRDYEKCKCIREVIMRKIEAQQAHNENIGKEKKKTKIKTMLLIAVLVFICLCIGSVMIELGKLILFGVTEIRYMEVVRLLGVYAIISLTAAGRFYYITKEEDA